MNADYERLVDDLRVFIGLIYRSGEMTPNAKQLIENILDQHEEWRQQRCPCDGFFTDAVTLRTACVRCGRPPAHGRNNA